MEKNLITMFFATIALSAAMTFSSCSKDGNESQGGVPASSINPLSVFTGGLPKGLDGIQILTDAKGRVYAMKSSDCLLYTSPSPRDAHESRMPSSA